MAQRKKDIVLSREQKSRIYFPRWLSSPWSILFSLIIGVCGIILAIYFYHISKKEPELTYFVHPIRIIVLKSGQASHLDVIYRDRRIKGDVTAVQVTIWNQGRQSIQTKDFLTEIKIVTKPQVPILEATILKQSRKVVFFSLDDSKLSKGVVPLSWKILEQNDGAIVQLIYEGPPGIEISVAGTIMEQAAPFKFEFPEITIKSPYDQLTSIRREAKWVIIASAVMTLLLIALGLLLYRYGQEVPTKYRRVIYIILAIFILFFIYAIIFQFKYFPKTPFGL